MTSRSFLRRRKWLKSISYILYTSTLAFQGLFSYPRTGERGYGGGYGGEISPISQLLANISNKEAERGYAKDVQQCL